MRASPSHRYRVQEIRDLPRTSHLSHLFPECVYTLVRLEGGRATQVKLRKSTGWKVGDTIEMDDLSLRVAALPT